MSAGLFSLPLQTFIQFKADPAKRGEVLAASSFINWVGILLASALTYLFSGPLGLSAAQGFSMIGIMTLILTVVTLWKLPDFLLRFVALATMRIFYRLRIPGAENLPLEGPALLIPNHVTWVNALSLTATNRRRIRFVMERSIYNTPLLRDCSGSWGSFRSPPKTVGRDSWNSSAGASRPGGPSLVAAFRGGVDPQRNAARVSRRIRAACQGSDYPIIPVYIGGAWGSILLIPMDGCCPAPPPFSLPGVHSLRETDVRGKFRRGGASGRYGALLRLVRLPQAAS